MKGVIEHCDDKGMEQCEDNGMQHCDDKGHGHCDDRGSEVRVPNKLTFKLNHIWNKDGYSIKYGEGKCYEMKLQEPGHKGIRNLIRSFCSLAKRQGEDIKRFQQDSDTTSFEFC